MTDTTPSVSEFDEWDETAETTALEDAATAVTVRHVIKNREYWALTPSGNLYKLPLFLSLADFEALSASDDATESVAQVKRILTAFMGDEQAGQLEHEPVQVVLNLLQDYGATITRIQGVGLGKSSASNASSKEKTAG